MADAELTLKRVLARPKETLTAHTLAVVAQVEGLAAQTLAEHPLLWQQVRLAAWLHDSGKLAQAFQRGLRQPKHRWGGRHEVLSLAFLPWLDVPPAWRVPISAAIVSHHRDWSLISAMYPPDTPHLQALVDELDEAEVEAWYAWLSEQGVPLSAYTLPTAASIEAALSALDEHLQTLEQLPIHDPARLDLLLLRGCLVQADHAAAGGVNIAAPLTSAPLPAETFTASPYSHQARARAANADVLITAPTGSGKTEAALLWASSQPMRRLFYVLPYRTSLNAMQQRLERVFNPVGLWHGRALHAIYHRMQGEGRSAEEATAYAQAAQTETRLRGRAVTVLSPYLLLASLYQLRGYEATLVDCYRASLIVDEIHTFEPERLAMLVTLLRWLKEHFHARLCVMSATMPPALKAALSEQLSLTPIEADPALYAGFQRHRLRLMTGDLLDDLDRIAHQAQAGMRVLVTVNTVERARAVARALVQRSCDVLTLHSRFTVGDRWEREQRLIRLLGASGPCPVVVSTQVIEVSLDVSFDVLYSDPAPLEALVQRLGRVNRRRERPLADGYIYTQPTGEGERFTIYDPAMVKATLQTLLPLDGHPLNEAELSRLLGEVYDQLPSWQAAFQKRLAHCERWVLGEMRPLESAGEALETAFYQQIDEVLVLPLALEDQYKARRADDPLGASELFVPLRWGQYKMLEGQRRAWRSEDGRLFYANAHYDDVFGLQLDEEAKPTTCLW